MSRRDGPPVCKFWLQDRCLAGDRCRYAHPGKGPSRMEQHQAALQQNVQRGQYGGSQHGGRLPGSAVNAKAWTPGASWQPGGSGGGGAAAGYGSGAGSSSGGGDNVPSRFVQLGGGAAAPTAAAVGSDSLPASLVGDGGGGGGGDEVDDWYVPDEQEMEFEADAEEWLAQQGGEDEGEVWTPPEGAEGQQQGGRQAGQQDGGSGGSAWHSGASQHQQGAYSGGGGGGGGQRGGYSAKDCSEQRVGGYNEAPQEWYPEGRGGGGAGDVASGLEDSFGGLSVQQGGGGGSGDCAMQRGIQFDLCQICGRNVLDPEDGAQQAEHLEQCVARHERLHARQASADVECGICLERIVQKQPAAARKFGLLSCDHAFCLGCIRGWRGTGDAGGPSTDTARTCPLCRSASHFVTPSTVWPSSEEQKHAIINGYKAKLATIDCRHFAFGEGSCQFGTSCFYRHAYPDGTLWTPTLRKVGTADGEVKVVSEVRLSQFLDTAPAFGGRR